MEWNLAADFKEESKGKAKALNQGLGNAAHKVIHHSGPLDGALRPFGVECTGSGRSGMSFEGSNHFRLEASKHLRAS